MKQLTAHAAAFLATALSLPVFISSSRYAGEKKEGCLAKSEAVCN
jgi:hypothetical protein